VRVIVLFSTLALFLASAFVGCATVSKENRERAALHLRIGTGYLSQGMYPQAMTELLKAQALDPKNPIVLNNLGLAYYVRGRIPEAEKKFLAAIRAEPKYSDSKNNLARVYIEEKKFAPAIRLLKDVEGDLTYIYPEKTLSNLGMAYFESGDYKKAEDYLLRSLQIRREDCTTADYYGRTLYEMKRIKRAAVALDQAIEFCRKTKFEEPIYFSAMSYFALGEKEKTRARLDELFKNYPKSKYVAKAKGMLELLEQ
jgi:Tfp pilus assembly protein PilF